MFSTRKQWKILFFAACTACLFFSFSETFAFSSTSLSLPTDEITQVKTLLVDYCTQVLKSPAFVENDFLYNAKQSVFVHLLCRNVGLPSPYFAKEEKYFIRTGFRQLWFQDITVDQIDLCSPNSFSNDCDLATNIPKLFNAIMNDYINMKQPNLYGLSANFATDETKIIAQINLFSSGYFDGIQVCDILPRSYPQTCSMMKWYIRNVYKAVHEVNIFSATGILNLSDMKPIIPCTEVTDTWDVFYCGLYGSTWANLVSFVNLAYNELLYYRLFMGYYLAMIQKYPSILARNTYMTDYTSILKTFSTQYMWSKDALSLSLRMMRDTYMAFPFHVGFSMYQEDLDGFWKLLARIAPPIYTLYDKLRNVQAPQ